MMILLDIDDTLINHSKAEEVASLKFGMQFRNKIPSYSEDNFSKKWHEEAERHIQAFLSGEISFQEQRRRRIRSIFSDKSINDRQGDEIFEEYLQHYEDSWELFPDVIPFLKNNTKWEFAVLSDGAQYQQELKLQKTGIRQYFRFIITAESAGMSKPNPAFFAKACALAGSAPSDTYYIGDNIKKDAIGARDAGLNGVWLNRKRKTVAADIFSIEKLTDFMPKLKN
jgi:putative hydrolase of the HAD superfamily